MQRRGQRPERDALRRLHSFAYRRYCPDRRPIEHVGTLMGLLDHLTLRDYFEDSEGNPCARPANDSFEMLSPHNWFIYIIMGLMVHIGHTLRFSQMALDIHESIGDRQRKREFMAWQSAESLWWTASCVLHICLVVVLPIVAVAALSIPILAFGGAVVAALWIACEATYRTVAMDSNERQLRLLMDS
ncbi:hypothetical protein [Mollivirus kamchatka]|nr:hypothetical protein [Mollivirus kamchatka]